MGGLCDEDVLREIAEAMNNLEDLCKFQVKSPLTKFWYISDAYQLLITQVPLS